MKIHTLISMAFIAFLAAPLAANTTDDKIKDLQSTDDAKAIAAAQWLSKEKEKKAVEPLINVAKSERNPVVRIHAIAALGLIKEKGQATTALKTLIDTDANNSIVYASLVALLNIQDFDNADFKAAIEIADQKHQDDIYIKDILVRIHKALKK